MNILTLESGFTFELVIMRSEIRYKEVLDLNLRIHYLSRKEWFREGASSNILPFPGLCVSGTVSCQMKGRGRCECGTSKYKSSLRKLN